MRELMTRYSKNQMLYVNLKIFLWLRDVFYYSHLQDL